MAKVELLLGGKTRFAVLEALAEAKRPVTACRVAMNKGLDPAATYRCLAEFSDFGIVESEIKNAIKPSTGSLKELEKLQVNFCVY